MARLFPGGSSPCGGEEEQPWGPEGSSDSCCGRTGPSAGDRGPLPKQSYASAGVLPWIQGIFCNANNPCFQFPTRGESPGLVSNYNNSILARLYSDAQELLLTDPEFQQLGQMWKELNAMSNFMDTLRTHPEQVAGRGVRVERILKDDEMLTSFLLRDIPLTQTVVNHLVTAEIRPEQFASGVPDLHLKDIACSLNLLERFLVFSSRRGLYAVRNAMCILTPQRLQTIEDKFYANVDFFKVFKLVNLSESETVALAAQKDVTSFCNELSADTHLLVFRVDRSRGKHSELTADSGSASGQEKATGQNTPIVFAVNGRSLSKPRILRRKQQSADKLPLVLDNHSSGIDIRLWVRVISAVSEKLREALRKQLLPLTHTQTLIQRSSSQELLQVVTPLFQNDLSFREVMSAASSLVCGYSEGAFSRVTSYNWYEDNNYKAFLGISSRSAQGQYTYDNSTTPFCNDMMRELESNPATRIVWNSVKPMLMGQILYAPDSPAVRKIVKNSSGATAFQCYVSSGVCPKRAAHKENHALRFPLLPDL
ncbi:hypothetical protein WMY93_029633 [Mugilogobius chulae]|uniref:Uncharacterized protein n=1 Tax=Mugilogobius chulae TaxID=88201 RepID=A0AAW0MWD3_9GOBI